MGALHESLSDTMRIRLSVNLSPRQFQSPSLLMDIDRILGVTGFDPSCLTLEITEGVLMREFDQSVVVLNALKQRGIKVAVDDFGTGYSSLSYLKRLPVDVLKIDRSFVRGLCDSVEDAALVEAVLALARTLGLYVTAEGVETAEQLSHLRVENCDEVQGYLFSRPVAPRHIPQLLERWNGIVVFEKQRAQKNGRNASLGQTAHKSTL